MKSQTQPLVFGDFFRQRRLELGLTLRRFCELYNFDPGNISRLERGVFSPSISDEKLAGYATALRIKRDTEEWVLFHDLAHASRGRIPQDMKNDQEVLSILPAFFRTMRSRKMDKQKMEKLIKLLKK